MTGRDSKERRLEPAGLRDAVAFGVYLLKPGFELSRDAADAVRLRLSEVIRLFGVEGDIVEVGRRRVKSTASRAHPGLFLVLWLRRGEQLAARRQGQGTNGTIARPMETTDPLPVGRGRRAHR